MSHAVPRPSGLGRGAAGLAVAFITAITGTVLVAPAHASAATGPASQALVVLSEDHPARSRPDADAHRIESVPARRPLTGVRTVLPVLSRSTDGGGNSWVQVRLPGRPNGHKGWISARHTRGTFTEWQISVKLSTRRVIVYRHGRVARRFRAVVGKPSTPTPRGRFFIEEAVALSPFSPGGPFALATSARSNVLQEFEGGPGQIALHGTDNLSGSPGTAVSHGCIRVNTSAITWLARRIGGGVPVTITRQWTHEVADFDAWKPGFDEHGEVRREYGLSDAGLYRDEENANSVTILLSTDDVGRAREFLGSDDLRETMSKLGVVSQPDVWITNTA